MQPLVAAAELADIVGRGVEAAVAVADVETVVELSAAVVVAVVAVTEEAAPAYVQLFVVKRQSVLNCKLQRPKSIVLKAVLLTARFWLYNGQQRMGCWPLWGGETTSERP